MLHHDRIASVLIVTLNRPERMNALHPDLMTEFITVMKHAETDNSIHSIIIKGNGKAFCAGADLDYLLALKESSFEENRADVELLSSFFNAVYKCTKPVIAAVHGPALAGGCGLALSADYVVAHKDHAKFGFPEVKRGFIPAIVSQIAVDKVGIGITRHLLISGEVISAAEAYRLGLADYICDEPMAKAFDIANHWAKNPLATMRTIKSMLKTLAALPSEKKEDYLKELNLNGRFTPEFEAGIKQFLKKR